MKLSQKLTLLQVSFMGEFLLFALFVELSVVLCSVWYVQHLRDDMGRQGGAGQRASAEYSRRFRAFRSSR